MGRYYHNNYRGNYHHNNYHHHNNNYGGNYAPRAPRTPVQPQPNYIVMPNNQPQIPLGERIIEGLVVNGLPSMIISGISAFAQIWQAKEMQAPPAPELPPPPQPPRMPNYILGADGKYYDEFGNEVIPKK